MPNTNKPVINHTGTHNQRLFILNYLKAHQSATTLEFREMGICAPAPRILELRARGYRIETHFVDDIDSAGVEHHKIARYVFKGEAKKEVA